MITADTEHGYGYVLMNDSGDPIAVITPRANEKNVDITARINQSLSECYDRNLTVAKSEVLHLAKHSGTERFYAQSGDDENDVIPFKIRHIILYMV